MSRLWPMISAMIGANFRAKRSASVFVAATARPDLIRQRTRLDGVARFQAVLFRRSDRVAERPRHAGYVMVSTIAARPRAVIRSVGRDHHACGIASVCELWPRSMSATGGTGRKGIESDFRFWPVAKATAARHRGRFLGSTCRGLARMPPDISDNLTHGGQVVRY
jgi:hypothetical protein